MSDLHGKRVRYFRERKLAEANAVNPVKKDVSPEARRRLVREIDTRAFAFSVEAVDDVTFVPTILGKVRVVMGIDMRRPQADAVAMSTEDFLTYLEISMELLWNYRQKSEDFEALQSILDRIEISARAGAAARNTASTTRASAARRPTKRRGKRVVLAVPARIPSR
jgi:hypothetical protein